MAWLIHLQNEPGDYDASPVYSVKPFNVGETDRITTHIAESYEQVSCKVKAFARRRKLASSASMQHALSGAIFVHHRRWADFRRSVRRFQEMDLLCSESVRERE